jgi:hypothetical protein
MGLRSGSDSVAAVGSLCGVAVLEALLEGSGVAVLEALFEGGGGGSGHTADSVSSESRSTTLGVRWVDPMGRSRFVPSTCTLTFLVGIQAPV